MNKYSERIYNGIIKENPALVLMLGMCPTLAVTTSASNGLGMGLATLAVLLLSNLIISLMRKIIPDEVRLPAYIVIVASLVTVVELLIHAYLPALYSALGIYIPLIVVNCIILGRAEAYAAKNEPILAIMDGIGMGLGFTLALTVIGMLRELIGSGQLFGKSILPGYTPVAIFVKAPGAFLIIGFIVAVMNALQLKTEANKKVEGCDGCCASCQVACENTPKAETEKSSFAKAPEAAKVSETAKAPKAAKAPETAKDAASAGTSAAPVKAQTDKPGTSDKPAETGKDTAGGSKEDTLSKTSDSAGEVK